MPTTYKCTGCNDVFDNKTERNNHFRNVCQALASVTEANGTIHRIERIDGKFACPQCHITFTRADSLTKHSKTCMKKDGTESKSSLNNKD